MKKLFACAAAAAMTAAMAAVTFAGPTINEGQLIVGFDAEYPPYGYMDDNGEYTGFDLELAEAICEIEGWELVKTPIDWDSKDQELNTDKIDCIWSGFTVNGREDEYEWTISYVNNSQVVVVAENSDIKTLADLAGKTVGVQAGSSALALLEDEEGQKELADTFGVLQQFADYNTAFSELEMGSIDALAMDIGVAKFQIEGREGFMMLEEDLSAEEYGIGCKLGNEELAEILSVDLIGLQAAGVFDELAAKYGLEDMAALEVTYEDLMAMMEDMTEAVTE